MDLELTREEHTQLTMNPNIKTIADILLRLPVEEKINPLEGWRILDKCEELKEGDKFLDNNNWYIIKYFPNISKSQLLNTTYIRKIGYDLLVIGDLIKEGDEYLTGNFKWAKVGTGIIGTKITTPDLIIRRLK